MKHCPNPDCPHRRAVGSPPEFVDDARTSCSDCGTTLADGAAERPNDNLGPVPRALPWRLAITLAAPLVAGLASFVPVPGFDAARAPGGAPFWPALDPVSVVHLGLWPVLEAAVLVELAAVAVPGWRSLRSAVDGRRRLWRATLVVALVLAAWSAFAVARATEELFYSAGLYPQLVVATTLLAGTSALLALSALVSARGLAPGLAVVGLAGALPEVRGLLFQIREERVLTPQGLLYFVGPIAVTLLATAWILGAHRRIARTVVVEDDASPDAAGPYRGRRPPEPGQLPVVRVPASGVVPLWILPLVAVFVERIAAATGAFGLGGGFVALQTPLVTLLLVLTAGMALSLAWAPPLPLSRLWAKATDRKWEPIDERRARALRRPTLKMTFAYLALITLLAFAGGAGVWLLLFAAAAVAVLYDTRDEWRARHAHADRMITVAEEHRVEVADAAKLALERAGIPAHVRGIHLRALLRVIGPFAPMEIMVPKQAALDAKKVLKAL